MVGLPKVGLPKLPFGGKGKADDNEMEYRKFADNPETRPVNDDLLGYTEIRTDPRKMKRRTMSPAERGEWIGGLQGVTAERRIFRRMHARSWKLWDLFDLGRPVDVGYMSQGEAVHEKSWRQFYQKSHGHTYRERLYYKDRVGVTRGPCSYQDLKLAYGACLIDRDTFVWGGMTDEWVPLACVYGLDGLVCTPTSRGVRALTLAVHGARHNWKKLANKPWGRIKAPPIHKWNLDPFAGAGRDRERPLKETPETKGLFEDTVAAYEDDIERAGTVEYLEKRASGRSGRGEKLDEIDQDPDADERAKTDILTPKERANALEHKILAPRLAKQLSPDEYEDKLEERDQKDKLEHFMKTVTRKDVLEGRPMPEGVDVISEYNEVAVIDRPEKGSQAEKELWDDIQRKDNEDWAVTGPWREVFDRGQDERDKHAVPEGIRHKPRDANEQWRFNLPKVDPRLKVPLLEAIQKRVIREVQEAFAPETPPEEQTCRFPDFPWTNGSGGLPYDGLFDLTRPRGKRMPGAIQDAARRGGIPDRDLALMESWYINMLHPLDDPDLAVTWRSRFKRVKEERFMEKMLAGPWREPSRQLRWFPEEKWDDPYKDHEFAVDQRKGVTRYPYIKPYEYQSQPMPLELDRFARQFAPDLKSLDELPPDTAHVPYDGKLDRAPVAEWERPEGYGLFTFPGWRKLSEDMPPHKVENEEAVRAERKKLEKEFKELEKKETDVIDKFVKANKAVAHQPGFWEEKRDALWFRRDSMEELMENIKWRFNNREKIETVLSATSKKTMIESQAKRREQKAVLNRATIAAIEKAEARKETEKRRFAIKDQESKK